MFFWNCFRQSDLGEVAPEIKASERGAAVAITGMAGRVGSFFIWKLLRLENISFLFCPLVQCAWRLEATVSKIRNKTFLVMWAWKTLFYQQLLFEGPVSSGQRNLDPGECACCTKPRDWCLGPSRLPGVVSGSSPSTCVSISLHAEGSLTLPSMGTTATSGGWWRQSQNKTKPSQMLAISYIQPNRNNDSYSSDSSVRASTINKPIL